MIAHAGVLFATRGSRVVAVRLVAGLILCAIALSTPGFFSRPALTSLLTTVSFIGCVAVGMTLITISGNIMSFSLGALVGASAMVFILAVNIGGMFFGLLIAILFGGLVNCIQGFLIGWVRANPIIVSIAATVLIVGASDAFAERGTVYMSAGIQYGGIRESLGVVPLEFIVFLGAAATAQFILTCSSFGRNLLMVGSSFRAAEVAGIEVSKTISAAYLWSGMFTALAGILLAIRYGSATMSYGIGYEYDAISAVLVGGISIHGGTGSMWRTLAGIFVIALIQAVLLLRGFRQEWQFFFLGVIVLGVIALQTRATAD
jgi:ribose/xylose/arabinose/galactoside ABC-type transport system permease subunit